MEPKPKFASIKYRPSGKLSGKTAIITGGDSGIGRAVAVAFSREGCNTAIVYLNETKDAEFTRNKIEEFNGKCILIKGDVSSEKFCKKAVKECLKEFSAVDIVVNNAAVQYPQDDITKITQKQLEKTFMVNVFSQFYMVKAAVSFMKKKFCHYKHHFSNCIPRQQSFTGLFCNQGGNCYFHKVALSKSCKTRDQSKRRSTRSNLDTINTSLISSERRRFIWYRCPFGQGGAA